MSIISIIKSRRTTYQFQDKSIAEKTLLTCLEAAIWAPNHKLTQPWYFWSLGQRSHRLLAEIYADLRASKRSQNCPEQYEPLREAALVKFQSLPKVILVGQKKTDDPVILKEDYAACACAIQNFQLAAWELEIGVQWSTGPILQDQRTYGLLGANSEEYELIGALYIGYPATESQSRREALTEKLTQLD